MTDVPGEKGTVEVVTESDLIAARDRACAALGTTWETLVTWVDDCGCCLTTPDGISEHAAQRVWFVFAPTPYSGRNEADS